jgi:ABC-type phosphate transport system permease subunit
MGAIMANHMASGLKDISKNLPSVSPETLQKFSNPQLLLNAGTRSTMPPDVFAAVQKVLANSIDWVFITGVIFVFIGVIAAIFLGKARLSKSSEEDSEAADITSQKLKVELELH